jgi:uncharacterized damage-inducible protein DinB
MFRKIADFLEVWKYESAGTIKLYKQLNNEVLDIKIYPEGRDLLRLANHINETLTEMMHHAGLPIEENNHKCTTVEELISQYQTDANEVGKIVEANWSDDHLEDIIKMYGMDWNKGTTLHILVTHQTHHRGQFTVLMRQAGLKVPGVYGPSKEEWIAYGQEPLA